MPTRARAAICTGTEKPGAGIEVEDLGAPCNLRAFKIKTYILPINMLIIINQFI